MTGALILIALTLKNIDFLLNLNNWLKSFDFSALTGQVTGGSFWGSVYLKICFSY